MIKLAVYGKGGIGKSTTVSNVSAALADMGYKVMQIGCDPKADSTASLCGGIAGAGEKSYLAKTPVTVLDLVRQKKDDFALEDMVRIGYGGVVCVEAGGPSPGVGCAGRGIIAALEKLAEKGAYETYKPDVVLYEEALDDTVIRGAVDAIAKADTLIVGGTSLVVYPAAGLIHYFRGKDLILINKSSTQADKEATLVIHDSIGKVLGD